MKLLFTWIILSVLLSGCSLIQPNPPPALASSPEEAFFSIPGIIDLKIPLGLLRGAYLIPDSGTLTIITQDKKALTVASVHRQQLGLPNVDLQQFTQVMVGLTPSDSTSKAHLEATKIRQAIYQNDLENIPTETIATQKGEAYFTIGESLTRAIFIGKNKPDSYVTLDLTGFSRKEVRELFIKGLINNEPISQ